MCFGKELTMEDFPIWLKVLVWLIVGGTVVYAIGAMVYTGMMG
jgi:membrane protein required for beta-lactamase induction